MDIATLSADARIEITPDTIAHQQFLDGRALWRLREALPDKREFGVFLVVGLSGPRWVCQVTFPHPLSDPVEHEAMGASIAEAADKCREALQEGS